MIKDNMAVNSRLPLGPLSGEREREGKSCV